MPFVVQIDLKTEGRHDLHYDSLDECLRDVGLKALFDKGLIATCVVRCGQKSITALPRALVSWDRLRDNLISNSVAILRGMEN